MRRRTAVLGAFVAVMSQFAVGAAAGTPAHDHGDHVHGPGEVRRAPAPVSLPAADPARGVVLEDLRAPSTGPCVGLLEVVEDDAPADRCTHGPDLAPPDGVDVRTADVDRDEAAAIVESAPAFSCDGNGTSGRRAHAIYAHTPDRPDRFAQKKAMFQAIVANVQDQFRQSSILHGASDPLVFRFTHTVPSGGTCVPRIDSVNLPSNTDDDSFGKTVDALEAMGYTRSDRRYLVFVDANVLCGIGHLYSDDRADPTKNWNNVLGSPLFSRVDAGCWNYAETHELAHNIGAVQWTAPNTSGAGHCNDDHDVMCYADGGASSSMYVRSGCTNTIWEKRLDCGGDDYFHPNPKSGSYLDDHWNIADSGWLFTEAGSGGGAGGGSTDGKAPTISIAAPSSSTTMVAPVTVRGSVGDVDGDLDRVVVKLDGKAVATLWPTGSTWSASVTPGGGTRELRVTAFDDGGRYATAQRTISVLPDLFRDDDTSVFESDIQMLAHKGVTRGCNPPKNDRFCPDSAVTRGQMAAFLTRALDLPAGSASFEDTGSSPFKSDIAALAKAGITRGCNPPKNDRFCPDRPVTRGEMAALMTRALDLPAGSATFKDTGSSQFKSDVGALAKAGITRGCNPPTNDRFCPSDTVTRGQMAAFMVRALYR